ncbi:MAG: P-II family nitrogen regulator [Balneolia bacterium]|nr:P-II family nitrogen regulator [Balneolia bacterium]
MTDCVSKPHKLLITIVDKGKGSDLVAKTKQAGCQGGTIIPGLGTRMESAGSFFGFTFDPEKDIIFSLVEEEMAYKMLHRINDEASLDEPGQGIAFLLDVSKAAGIAHLLNQAE